MRAAILRACAFFFFASAVWALLAAGRARAARAGAGGLRPDAGRGGRRGRGGGVVLPPLRARLSRGSLVFWASLLACAAMALLGLATHWALAGVAMLLYGAAWLAAGSTLQVAAQLAAPGWVRARALGVYQLCFFGALALGAVVWGWVGAALRPARRPWPLRRSRRRRRRRRASLAARRRGGRAGPRRPLPAASRYPGLRLRRRS